MDGSQASTWSVEGLKPQSRFLSSEMGKQEWRRQGRLKVNETVIRERRLDGLFVHIVDERERGGRGMIDRTNDAPTLTHSAFESAKNGAANALRKDPPCGQ